MTGRNVTGRTYLCHVTFYFVLVSNPSRTLLKRLKIAAVASHSGRSTPVRAVYELAITLYVSERIRKRIAQSTSQRKSAPSPFAASAITSGIKKTLHLLTTPVLIRHDVTGSPSRLALAMPVKKSMVISTARIAPASNGNPVYIRNQAASASAAFFTTVMLSVLYKALLSVPFLKVLQSCYTLLIKQLCFVCHARNCLHSLLR